jgi:hypothetical protein
MMDAMRGKPPILATARAVASATRERVSAGHDRFPDLP